MILKRPQSCCPSCGRSLAQTPRSCSVTPSAFCTRKIPPQTGSSPATGWATWDIIQAVTDEYLASFGVPAERLTSAERQKIVQELDRRGGFLVKGSIAEVAKRLGCSEVTIYRYLQ